jgi:hypothetical protein
MVEVVDVDVAASVSQEHASASLKQAKKRNGPNSAQQVEKHNGGGLFAIAPSPVRRRGRVHSPTPLVLVGVSKARFGACTSATPIKLLLRHPKCLIASCCAVVVLALVFTGLAIRAWRNAPQVSASDLKNPVEYLVRQVDCEKSRYQMLPATVDLEFTSPGTRTRSGWLHRMFLALGEATGLRTLRRRAELFRSRPASVIVRPEPPIGGDCLAIRPAETTGSNRSVSVALSFGALGAAVEHIVIEQPSRSSSRLWSSPGRFRVFGEPVAQDDGAVADLPRYSLPLGIFEYKQDMGTAAQAFDLRAAGLFPGTKLRGVRMLFDFDASGDGKGDSYICVYRLLAFKGPVPFCTSSGRVLSDSVAPVTG